MEKEKNKVQNGYKCVARNVKKIVENHKDPIICISQPQDLIKIDGDKNIVKIFEDEEKLQNMTLKEFLKICRQSKSSKEYATFYPPVFPPLVGKFKGELWTWKQARENLTTYLSCLGFGKGQHAKKKYRDPQDKPSWWTFGDTDAKLVWENFRGPSYLDMNCCNTILEHLMSAYSIDHNTFFVQSEATQVRKRKKTKPAKSAQLLDDTIDDIDDRVPQVDEVVDQDVEGRHDEETDSDADIDAYEALASNYEESGSEKSSSDESDASDVTQKKKKTRIESAPAPEPTEISAYEKDRNERVAQRRAQEMEIFGYVVQ